MCLITVSSSFFFFSKQPKPKGILRKTFSNSEDKSIGSESSASGIPTPAVVRRRAANASSPCSPSPLATTGNKKPAAACPSPASRLLRNLRSKSAEQRQAAARRQKHRESYVFDDTNAEDASGGPSAADDDESSATIGNTASNSTTISCGCRTPTAEAVIGSSGKRPDALELRSQVCSALFTLLSLPSTFLIVFSDLLYLV